MKDNIRLFERKELKYLLTAEQYEGFMESVSEYITPDEYPGYTICNMYMDTPDFRLIRNSIDKPVYKEKMRLRSYGTADGDTKVFVELKKKYRGIVYKRRIRLKLDEALSFISGETVRRGRTEEEIEYFLCRYGGISPAMFISYEREAFHALEDEDLRITFDSSILWRNEDVSLSSKYGHRLLENGQALLEIKCANAMPLWLVRALTENRIYRTSFSKYGKAYTQMSCAAERLAAGF